ncbi:WD repeat domain 92 [Absidia repens]|uniref:WD repeat domain 92 n=1 Tax=Absidia repens TaxID=90262 RepID=A0A1X2ILF3_9FUNG|nr:WD repeat domain 92 [Absidia repens]
MDPLNLITKELAFTAYDVKWVPSSARICAVGATGDATGKIAIFDMDSKVLALTSETETGSPFRCCTFGAADSHTRHLATGDFNGDLTLWDTQRLDIPIETTKAHDSIIHTIDGVDNSSRELVTGGRDGLVKVWDTRQLQSSVATIRALPSTEKPSFNPNEVWAVAFGNWEQSSQRVIAIGYDHGVVRLFDLVAGSYIWETNLGNGVCSLDFSKQDPKKLVASTLAGAFVIQLSDGKTTKLESPVDTTLWATQHAPSTQDEYFAIAAGNGTVSLWDHNNLAKPVGSSTITNHPVTSLDWHPTKKGLFVCSAFDQTVRLGYVKNLLLK